MASLSGLFLKKWGQSKNTVVCQCLPPSDAERRSTREPLERDSNRNRPIEIIGPYAVVASLFIVGLQPMCDRRVATPLRIDNWSFPPYFPWKNGELFFVSAGSAEIACRWLYASRQESHSGISQSDKRTLSQGDKGQLNLFKFDLMRYTQSAVLISCLLKRRTL